MQSRNGTILYSASDLVGFLECEHSTTLALADLVTPLQRGTDDESAILIQNQGYAHEAAVLDGFKARGLRVAEIADYGDPAALLLDTKAAMEQGCDIVYQGTLLAAPLYGRTDFLRRVERPSALGAWSYEVVDTKLARSTKAKFAVQLAFYSDLLAGLQGAQPQAMHLVLGDGSEVSFRVAEYLHYFAQVRDRFLAFVAGHPNGTYPQQCSFCQFCAWRELCDARWKDDDHLNQVAGITRNQIDRLQTAGTSTLLALAELPPAARVARMQPETLHKLRSQAALQLERRQTGEPRVEVLPLDPEQRRGFYRMPQPDNGDVFLDMEGDPFEEGGLEYLFGLRFVEDGETRFETLWAHDRGGERVAFEKLMDFLTQRVQRFPSMHIYHYNHYEPTALKRLMTMHGTRESQLDDLLRREKFVDLYKVVREAIRTSEPGLSIKDIEVFYMGPRDAEIRSAGASIVHYEAWRATRDDAELDKIRAYNEDDCRSTHLLRDWLLERRPEGVDWFTGARIEEDAKGKERSERTREIEAALVRYHTALVACLPTDRLTWGVDEHMRELVFQLLDFHRRAEKPEWWAMYARQDLTEEELIDDMECLGGLVRTAAQPATVKRSLVYEFEFPEQETKLRAGKSCVRCDTAEPFGSIESLDETRRIVSIKVGPKRQVPDALSIGPTKPIGTTVLREAIARLADAIIAGDGRFAAACAFLRRDAPSFRGRPEGVAVVDGRGDLALEAFDAILALDHSYLFVQGPPGSGKTTIGARLIVGLLRAGKRVGVTSNSHKVINNLLAAVEERAKAERFALFGLKKSGGDDDSFDGEFIENANTNDDVGDSAAPLIAGTAWLFADPQFEAAVDYLFVDEAGQVSVANLMAMATAARNVVLLGDQMQLGQPIQGVHPGRSGESALDYLLNGQATVAADRGIFLATSWRMHEDVCRFISDAVYDGRLMPDSSNARQRLVLDRKAHAALRPTGIRFLATTHEGCKQKSPAEAAAVKAILESLLAQHWIDKEGKKHRVTLADILIVAPYNAQVNLLRDKLPPDSRVGTIDKFQGQQAQVVLVSMTTSSADDLPRNIEFLYDKNRLNVAVSRAKCLAVVVGSPLLLHIHCHSPAQIELVNTLCWLREYAEGLPPYPS